jgi:hypothetical protein
MALLPVYVSLIGNFYVGGDILMVIDCLLSVHCPLYQAKSRRGMVTFLLKLVEERLKEYSGRGNYDPIVKEILVGL